MAKRRWIIQWIDQNVVRVTDTRKDDEFYMNGHAPAIRRYEELPPAEANAYWEGFLSAADWCDGQLKHVDHNFLWRE